MPLTLIRATLGAALLTSVVGACNGAVNNANDPTSSDSATAAADPQTSTADPASESDDAWPFVATAFGEFNQPWAMSFLPDGRLLITQKTGEVKLFDPQSKYSGDVTGVPEVDHGGQGGLGDVVLHPQFSENNIVYLSYAEAGEGDLRGGAVARGKLVLDDQGGGALTDMQVIWRQVPKVTGRGHYAHRLVFSPDGEHLFISSGDRQKFDPAQDMQSNLGKIVRLYDDGGIPGDNPFANKSANLGGIAAQIWTLGHRNPLGLAFDAQGQLWNHEMGPKGGDEVNLIVRAENYGYPIVSDGDHYDGRPIPDHDTRPEFYPPATTWTPVISPAGLVIYSGAMFPDWKGRMLIGGLSSQALVVVTLEGKRAYESARYDMSARIREIEQGPDGAVWLLEDGNGGRLLKLTAR